MTRRDIIAAARIARDQIPAMRNGEVSSATGRAPLGDRHVISACFTYSRMSGRHTLCYYVDRADGQRVADNTRADSLADVIVRNHLLEA